MSILQNTILKIIKPSINEGYSEEGSRNLLISLAILMSLGGIVWGSLLVYFNIYTAALIPYSYVVISIINISLVSYRKLKLARNIQILISMLLPFGLQWMLGGFFSSGVVMLWSTLSLVGSVTLLRGGFVYQWLIFFVVLTLFSFWIDPVFVINKPEVLTPNVSIILLVINIFMISSIVFILSKKKSDRDLEINQQLEHANRELGKHKDKLEQLVRERTEQLEANISLLKIIQEDMKKAKEEAEKANDAKSQFLANMSHEIRSPLNAILGFSQIMSMSSKESNLSSDFKQYLDIIKLSGENLLELINNILDLSKIEAGKTHLSFETINIKQLFKGIYQINKGKGEEKGIQFTYEIDHLLPDFIEGDRTKLNQILMNLTTNAVKFTPGGKSVHMKAGVEGNNLIFEITDTGVGISSDRIPFIFDPFEQADNSITRKFGGTGLGLTITKKLIELLKGKIYVKSTEHVGSTFTVVLPLIHSISPTQNSKDNNTNSISFNNKLRALIVEDNSINQQLLRIVLSQMGIESIQVYNGKDGIDKLKEIRPDLIIMDIHMPIMDGMEAIQIIRANPHFDSIPIICLTADAFMDQQKKALSLGANDYLTKPIEMPKFIEIITKYFDYRQYQE